MYHVSFKYNYMVDFSFTMDVLVLLLTALNSFTEWGVTEYMYIVLKQVVILKYR